MSGSRASSFGRFGRSDWSSKLIRGLRSKTAAGFRSRRGRCHEPTPVTPHYASFASYKTAGVHCGARRRGWVAAPRHGATADEANQWPRHRVTTGFLDSRFSIWSVDSPSQTALPAILCVPSDRLRRFGFLRHAASINRKVSNFNPAERPRLLGADSRGTAARSYGHERATSQRGPPKKARSRRSHCIYHQRAVQKNISRLATCLRDEQAAVASGAVQRAIVAAVMGSWSAHTGSPAQRRVRSRADFRTRTNRRVTSTRPPSVPWLPAVAV